MATNNDDKVGKEDSSERIAVEELEAKMSSVQEALERFDAVKVCFVICTSEFFDSCWWK